MLHGSSEKTSIRKPSGSRKISDTNSTAYEYEIERQTELRREQQREETESRTKLYQLMEENIEYSIMLQQQQLLGSMQESIASTTSSAELRREERRQEIDDLTERNSDAGAGYEGIYDVQAASDACAHTEKDSVTVVVIGTAA